MPSTPTSNCAIPRGWSLGEDGWDVGDDLGRQIIDCLLTGTVKNIVTTLPSSGQVLGDTYIMAADAGTHARELAMWVEDRAAAGYWFYLVPKEGWTFFVVAAGRRYRLVAGPLWVLDHDTPRIQVIAAATGSITLDWGNYDEIRLTLTGNVTLTPSGAEDGQGCILKIKQDGVGSRTVNLSSLVRFNSLIPSYAPSPTPAMADKLGLIYDGSDNKYDLVSLTPGMV